MKKLKSIFSPRKVFMYLLLIVLALTVPAFNQPIMSSTDAIVTVLAVDEKDNNAEISVVVLSPSQGQSADYKVYSGEGETLGTAVESVELMIGKQLAFDQCEVMAIGDGLSEKGVMKSLDYMTRTKKVGRNAYVMSFSGKTQEFASAMVQLTLDKSLKLANIFNFDSRYIIANDSNIEKFYIGYYSPISLGIMPKIKVSKTESKQSIELPSESGGKSSSGSSSSGSSGSSGGEGSSGSSDKMYLENDGSMAVFKKGLISEVVPGEIIKEVSLFNPKIKKGALVVRDIFDDLYDNVDAVISIRDKNIELKPKFVDGKPILDINLELSVFVEEVIEERPTEKMLRRNSEFLTDTAVKRIKNATKIRMLDVAEYCKEKKVDLIGIYNMFYSLQNKNFEKYLDRVGLENYLDEVEYNIKVRITTEY